jgi:hypothetical protein
MVKGRAVATISDYHPALQKEENAGYCTTQPTIVEVVASHAVHRPTNLLMFLRVL